MDVGTIRKLRALMAAPLLASLLAAAPSPVLADASVAVTQVVAVGTHACALTSTGTVYCWGSDVSNQLGDGTSWSSSVPLPVPGLTGVRRLGGGTEFTCAVLDSGAVRCWGQGATGQLGDGLAHETATPVTVAGVTHAIDVVGGEDFACALTDAGSVFCWGSNSAGQLGQGTVTTATPTLPTEVGDLAGYATHLTAGDRHACAILVGGVVSCWGRNVYGQTGQTATLAVASPTLVPGITTAVAIDAGGDTSCAVIVGGTARCWGNGDNGQLGNAGWTSTATPQLVESLGGATDISVGHNHACARVVDGSARCWGHGASGQLGSNTIDPVLGPSESNTPIVVTGLANAVAVEAGTSFSCAWGGAGALSCWGYGGDGALANGAFLTGAFIGNALTPMSAVWDSTAPTATNPVVIPRVGWPLVGTAVPLAVETTVTDPDPVSSGPGFSRFQLSRNAGVSWTAQGTAGPLSRDELTAHTAPVTAVVNAPTTGTVRLRVVPVDRAGNAGTPSTGPTLHVTLVQDTSTLVKYAGSWSTVRSAVYSGGSTRATGKTGGSATLTFTGRAVGVVSTVGLDRGFLRVYVNGVLKATVDLTSGSLQRRTIVWSMRWATSGTRTIKVVSSVAPGTKVDLDAFVVVR